MSDNKRYRDRYPDWGLKRCCQTSLKIHKKFASKKARLSAKKALRQGDQPDLKPRKDILYRWL